MKWDRYTADGDRVLLLSKFLLSFGGRRLDLHRIVAADPPGQFHSHPARAIRMILWGGYVEELPDGAKRTWRPGMIGYIPGSMSHRLHAVRGRCYTLWLRGRDRFTPAPTANVTRLFADDGSDAGIA